MKLKSVISTLALSTLASPLFAATVDLKLTNLTNGQWFTPVLVAAHNDTTYLFKVGQAASTELKTLAEAGSPDSLKGKVEMDSALTAVLADGGPTGPGKSVMAMAWSTGDMPYLSVAGMLLPTNDGFVGLDSWKIPSTPGTYTIYLNGYDAGTEINDEISMPGEPGKTGPGIPGFPGMDAGENGTGAVDPDSTENTMVHVHRGVLGDTDSTGGKSDINSTVHRWLNPVAKLVVTVTADPATN